MILFGAMSVVADFVAMVLSPCYLGINLCTFLVCVGGRFHEGLEVNMVDHWIAITFALAAYGDVEEEWTTGHKGSTSKLNALTHERVSYNVGAQPARPSFPTRRKTTLISSAI